MSHRVPTHTIMAMAITLCLKHWDTEGSKVEYLGGGGEGGGGGLSPPTEQKKF